MHQYQNWNTRASTPAYSTPAYKHTNRHQFTTCTKSACKHSLWEGYYCI